LAGRRSVLIVAKSADITGEAIFNVIVNQNVDAIVRIELSWKAGFARVVESGVGSLVGIVFTGRADGAGGYGVVVIFRCGVIGVEAASRACGARC
jgi:hypothetical protein